MCLAGQSSYLILDTEINWYPVQALQQLVETAQPLSFKTIPAAVF